MTHNEPTICYDVPFFRKHPFARSLLELFELLPSTVFYAKDRQSRYVAGNSAMLHGKNLKHGEELLGRTDRDFHPPLLAEAYLREDQKVFETGCSVTHEIWFVLETGGRPGWYDSSKIPLWDGGRVIGLAGVRYAVKTPEQVEGTFERLAPAIRWLENRYTESVSMEELAELTGLSRTHFNRQFQLLLRIPPTRFLHMMRIEKARQLLSTTDLSIARISAETGYWDQSHFTRYFTRITGISPRRYRNQFRNR